MMALLKRHFNLVLSDPQMVCYLLQAFDNPEVCLPSALAQALQLRLSPFIIQGAGRC